jgi:DNA topoisomerase-2
MVEELVKRNYDPDPVAKWKSAHAPITEESQDDQNQSDSELEGNYKDEEAKAKDFDYLMTMHMWSLTLEKKEELLRKKQEKHQELEKLRATSKEQLWKEDLTKFLEKLDEVEQKQLENQEAPTKKAGKKDASRKKTNMNISPVKGIRIVPQISGELRKKATAAVEKKDKKNAKDVFGKSLKDKMAEFEPDEFDDMADDKEHNRSLSDRLGFSLKAEEKPKGASKSKRESPKKSKTKKVQSKTPWDEASPSDSDMSSIGISDSDSDADVFK